MDDIIKIGISGNALGSGGYCNLINVGFDDVAVNRQVSFNGQTDTEYSIEVQQGKNEAIFVLVANPLTVYSAGASRGGALCIFLSIPAGKYVRKKDTTPLTILHDILKKFREENMIQRGNVWEYQYKAFYDRTPFQKLSEDTKQYLAELPTYVPMAGNSELLVSIGTKDRLNEFFEGDFQYSDFNKCSRLIIADQIIDGISWENVTIPRSWSLDVYYGSSFVEKLDSSKPEISHKFSPAQSDADIYDETEIKLRLDGYNVKPTGCEVNVKWNDEKVEIKSIQWNLRQIFVPITLKGEGIESLSPNEIHCTIDDAKINPVEKEGKVIGFEFKGPQIRDVKEDNFRINNDSYKFTVKLDIVDNLLKGINIIAEPKQEPVQTQISSTEPIKTNITLPPSSNPSQFSQSAQDYANTNPKTGNCNEGETAGHIGENLQQKPSTQKQVTETNTSNNVTDGVSEVKKESEESKFKFYRKKEFWIGLAAGIILGFGMGFLTWSVYNNLLKSDYEKFLNYQKPTESEGNLFLYDENELNEAIDLCVRANSLSNSRKVISEQAEHFKNLLYNLEDNGYKLKFEDPAIIKKWVENEKIDSLGIPDIVNIKKWIDTYSEFGDFLDKIIDSQDRNTALVEYMSKKQVTKIRELLESYNNKLKVMPYELKPIRICIQPFYLSTNDGTLKCKELYDSIFKDNNGTYSFTSNCFIDIYKEAQPIIDPQQ